jgi:septum formation protein
MTPRVVLASASPRRRELLAAAGLAFEVAPVPVDEALDEFDRPDDAALELARRKAQAAARQLAARCEAALVVGADTVVAVQDGDRWRLLGKAQDEREARTMLSSLSGTRHVVVTGVCVVRAPGGAVWCAAERTWVTMRALAEAELAAYVASGEWRDKAGAYAIQESADRFVVGLEGAFDNVVGLPVRTTLELLERAGLAGGGA